MHPKSSPARVFLAGASTGLSASQFQHGAKMRSQFQHGPSAFLGPNIYIAFLCEVMGATSPEEGKKKKCMIFYDLKKGKYMTLLCI